MCPYLLGHPYGEMMLIFLKSFRGKLKNMPADQKKKNHAQTILMYNYIFCFHIDSKVGDFLVISK